MVSKKSYKYAWLLVSNLENALNDQSYDFAKLFENDDDQCIYFPLTWQIKNPRAFFEEILKVAKEEWKDDLEKASREDPSTW